MDIHTLYVSNSVPFLSHVQIPITTTTTEIQYKWNIEPYLPLCPLPHPPFIIVLNISSAYTEVHIRQCCAFCFQCQTLRNSRKSTVFTQNFGVLMRNLLLFELFFPYRKDDSHSMILRFFFLSVFSLKFNYDVSWHDLLWICLVLDFLSFLNL